MASINCANCQKKHTSVAEVKECYLSNHPALVIADPDAPRPNRYAGKCVICRVWVEKEAGHIEKVNGKYAVFHNSGECVSKMAEVPAEPGLSPPNAMDHADVSYPDVPAGHYAIPSLTGNNDLDFFRVDRPMEGTWSGATFVKRVIGGRPDSRARGARTIQKILQAILDADPAKAMALYGQELGQCGKCNRHLTDEESRKFGIGPTCRSAS